MNYLIWSTEHNAWWRAGCVGYATRIEEAGQYTREQAIRQCAFGRDGWGGSDVPPEIPVREEDALECARLFGAAIAKAG